ncbi:MAG: hypothetical protein IJ558_02700 [Treponema sp.]|nr:hypothetical protein [Treponema sp.]
MNVFSRYPQEKADIKKQNGAVIEDISILFTPSKILSDNVNIKIEAKDIIIRKMNNEKLLVVNPNLYPKTHDIPAHYQIDFSKDLDYFAKKDSNNQQTIINANNSNINLGTMIDSSQTINKNLDYSATESLIKMISQNVENTGLSTEARQKLVDDIEEIKIAITKKDTNKIVTLLQGIKELCFNVTGNLVASGIIQQISTLLP